MSASARGFAAWRGAGPAIWNSPAILLFLASVCWALNPIVGRAVREVVSPLSLAFWRWVVAFAVVLPFAWGHLRADRGALRASALSLILLGSFGLGLFAFLGYLSLQYTTATNNLLLQATMPIMILLIPAVLFGERLRPLLVLSAGLSFAGIVWIVTKGNPLDWQAGAINRGDLLAVTGVFLYSLYATFLRKAPVVHHLTLLAAFFAIGAATLAIPYLATLPGSTLSMPRAEVLAAVVYVGIFPSVVAYALFNRAVVLIGSVRAGVYMNLPPVIGVGLAVPLLGESLASYHFVGALMIVIAIAISRGGNAKPVSDGKGLNP